VHVDRVESARELLGDLEEVAALAIDVPIGLPDAGPRACDAAARRELGRPRSSSVFPAPVRPALAAASRQQASEITRAVDGRGVGAQAFGIWPKIREVDAILSRAPGLQRRVREVHPELAFQMLNSGRPLRHSKHDSKGLRTRIKLVDACFGPGTFAGTRESLARGAGADDDVLDALACLWSAGRIARGQLEVLPADPPLDRCGLRMEICY
jgi:predicted RNase H-like nuclease